MNCTILQDCRVCNVCNERVQCSAKTSVLCCLGCNFWVHIQCYGAVDEPSKPDGSWSCNWCAAQIKAPDTVNKTKSCRLCPSREGALKRVADNHWEWAHIICATYLPQAEFTALRASIIATRIPTDYFNKRCYVCVDEKKSENQCTKGACIKCLGKPDCEAYFHVTCGRRHGLVRLSQLPNKSWIKQQFCRKHQDILNAVISRCQSTATNSTTTTASSVLTFVFDRNGRLMQRSYLPGAKTVDSISALRPLKPKFQSHLSTIDTTLSDKNVPGGILREESRTYPTVGLVQSSLGSASTAMLFNRLGRQKKVTDCVGSQFSPSVVSNKSHVAGKTTSFQSEDFLAYGDTTATATPPSPSDLSDNARGHEAFPSTQHRQPKEWQLERIEFQSKLMSLTSDLAVAKKTIKILSSDATLAGTQLLMPHTQIKLFQMERPKFVSMSPGLVNNDVNANSEQMDGINKIEHYGISVESPKMCDDIRLDTECESNKVTEGPENVTSQLQVAFCNQTDDNAHMQQQQRQKPPTFPCKSYNSENLLRKAATNVLVPARYKKRREVAESNFTKTLTITGASNTIVVDLPGKTQTNTVPLPMDTSNYCEATVMSRLSRRYTRANVFKKSKWCCKKCNKYFSSNSNLRFHHRLIHSGILLA